jgi:hypothetical protein
MFCYNKLSDLKNGLIVIPLRKEGDFVIALDGSEEIKLSFDDFDFAKNPKDRVTIEEVSAIMEEDLKEEEVIPASNLIIRENLETTHYLSKQKFSRKERNFYIYGKTRIDIERESIVK